MATYRVQVIDISADGADYPWQTLRRVLSVKSAPCLSPVLIRLGGHVRRIACGRRLPMEQQCRTCTPVVIVVDRRGIIR